MLLRKFSLLLLFPIIGVAGGEVKPGSPSVAPVREDPTYELRGFFGKGDKLEVSIRDSRKGSSRWLYVGKKAGGLLIEKADAKSGTATLIADGVKKELKLVMESPPPVALPATRENLERLLSRRDEVLMRPGIGEKLNAMIAEVDGRFNKEHPEYLDLMKKILGAHEDTPEFREIQTNYDRLSEQRSDLFKTFMTSSADSDLVEFSRLNDAALEMSAKLPPKFELGFRHSYGGSSPAASDKPASAEPAPAPVKK